MAVCSQMKTPALPSASSSLSALSAFLGHSVAGVLSVVETGQDSVFRED